MFASFKGINSDSRLRLMTASCVLAWVTVIDPCDSAANAAVKPKALGQHFPDTKEQDFPTDPFVRRQVRFWEAIFQKYKSNSVVIHDLDDPLAMIDVIDFDRYITGDGKVMSIEDSDQTNLVKKYIDRYNVAVERFAKYQDGALKFGPIEQRLFEVYNREPQSLARLYAGNVKFRGQGGLADTFLAAANRAQEYMPYMEKTFRKYGLPVTLTRLPFVESMFNLNARSKVGASGIWQFMPDTAKEFMYVGPLADERNNPYKATHGAAQLFKVNYRELGTWPLAVTAYNHGRAGMSKAAREVGTSQLGSIINHYKSGTFGFASKNFYAEFLAAARTYDLVIRTGMVKPETRFPGVETVTLTKPLSVRDITQRAKISVELLGKMNPCLTAASLGSRSDIPLPHGYEIRLPKREGQILRRSLADRGYSKSNARLTRR
jgi:membrane-bound lytic murein transglycosylase D